MGYETTTPLLNGIYPAIVTPVDAQGQLIEESIRALVRQLADSPIDGLYVGGGTGEGILLPVSVRKQMLEIVVDEIRILPSHSSLKVVAHVGAAEAVNTADLAKHAKTMRVDAISAIPPLYYTYSREQICAYYGWLSSITDIPLIIYASAYANVCFTMEMVKELLAYPNIKGLKFGSTNFYEMMRIRSMVPDDFSLLNGIDEQLMFGLLAGVDGGIGTTYNVMPQSFCNLYAAWRDHEIETMRILQKQINTIVAIIIKYPVIAAVKTMLDASGIPMGPSVFPNDEFPIARRAEFLESLRQVGWPKLVP